MAKRIMNCLAEGRRSHIEYRLPVNLGNLFLDRKIVIFKQGGRGLLQESMISVKSPAYSDWRSELPCPGIGKIDDADINCDNQPECLRSNRSNISVGRNTVYEKPELTTSSSCKALLEL